VNTGAPWPTLAEARVRVLGIQTKLHRWAHADEDRRFDDLFNLVTDPAFLVMAWLRVRGNKGSRSAGVDGQTAREIEQRGVEAFLGDLRDRLKTRTFQPLPVRERAIPKPGTTKKRRLGIPTVGDRVVQASLKLVLEPIFEADFHSFSYGFRPRRRPHDAIEEIRFHATRSYEWVLEADIEACFDTIDHTALMDRVRRRVGDKRVLALVKAFLKAGILSEDQVARDTNTGTPQGGILSPLLANIALSALDERLHRPWEPGGTMSTESRRAYRRRKGHPTWRVVRYADDFVVLVHGTQADTAALREDVADVLEPLGLRLSQAKTRAVHMSDGFDFLGFRIQWKRKGGTNQWHVYTFIADRPIRSLKAKIRAITRRTSQQELAFVLRRLAQIMRGWANYFKHAVAKHVFDRIDAIVWWRLIRMLAVRHRWRWGDVRRRFTTPTGRWRPIAAQGIELFRISSVTVSRYRYRASAIPSPWQPAKPRLTAETVESPLR
jgi:RNA-directed DNA polymerase